jgi:hypothetical protein
MLEKLKQGLKEEVGLWLEESSPSTQIAELPVGIGTATMATRRPSSGVLDLPALRALRRLSGTSQPPAPAPGASSDVAVAAPTSSATGVDVRVRGAGATQAFGRVHSPTSAYCSGRGQRITACRDDPGGSKAPGGDEFAPSPAAA